MFRFFESLVDPYASYSDRDTPAGPALAVPEGLPLAGAPGDGVDRARDPGGRGGRGLADLVRGPARRHARRSAPAGGLDAARARARARRALHPGPQAGDPDAERAPPQPVADAERRHHRALAQPSPRAAPVGRLVPERLRRPHRQPDDADRARGRRGDVPDLRRPGLRLGLPRRRALAARRRGPAAGAAARRLARPLPLARRLDGAPGRPRLEGVLRRPLGDHRADRRQLHQHRLGQALRPHPLARRPTPARRSSTRARPSPGRCGSSP